MAKPLDIWKQNAQPWIATLDQHEISSRQATSPAIIAAVQKHQPGSVLDLGCGEGWLFRELRDGPHPPHTRVGIDGVAGLIDVARQRDPTGHYHCLDYERLQELPDYSGFDLILCNYALFAKDEVVALLQNMHRLLAPEGRLLIQTVHPDVFGGPARWLDENWHLMQQDYIGNYQWYFRDWTAWAATFAGSGWQELARQEVDWAGRKVSVVFELGSISQK